MLKFFDESGYLSRMRQFAGNVMQETSHILSCEYGIGSTGVLVGSGKRKFITQNGNEPIDLDYNLIVQSCYDIDDCKTIKWNVKEAFDQAFIEKIKIYRRSIKRFDDQKQHTVQDSHSVLTSPKIYFTSGSRTPFSIDLCIVREEQGRFCRLIHNNKTRWAQNDTFCWEQVRNSKNIKEKENFIKENGLWDSVKKEYLNIKKINLSRQYHDKHSISCYMEAVSNVYNKYSH